MAEERVRKEAEAKAAAEAKAREEARKKAEQEAHRLAEEKRLAEQRAAAEAKAREEARQKAEQEAQRLAEEKRVAEEKAKAEAEASRLAEEKAKAQAEARARAEEEAKAKEAARIEAERRARSTAAAATPVPASNMRSKVTNVDIVNRSLDRSQMTIGVEFDYKDDLAKPYMGVDVTRTGDSQSGSFFKSQTVEIKRSSQKLALFPVRYQPPDPETFSSFSTDRILIYLQDTVSMQKYTLLPATMLLMWRVPGAAAPNAAPTGTLQLTDFKQNDLFSGYISLNYTLSAPSGTIRAKMYHSANATSAKWFKIQEVPVRSGSGLQVVQIFVRPDAESPSDIINVDTIDVELVDAAGTVVANVRKDAPKTWARPK